MPAACAPSVGRAALRAHGSAHARRDPSIVASASGDRPRAAVVGAGVVGLTVTSRLLDANFHVTVYDADESDAAKVSHGAGGFWFPYLVEPMDRASAWASAAYRQFLRDVDGDDPLVRLRQVFLYDDRDPNRPPPVPEWAPPDLRELRPEELPDIPGVSPKPSGGWHFAAPVVEMPRYMARLRSDAVARGAKFRAARLDELATASPPDAPSDVIVNCAGLGNAARHRRLARDSKLIPIRGQIVRATAPRVTSVYLAELGQWSYYAIPRGDCVVFGGTHEEGEWDEAPDEEVAREIMRRVEAMLPEGAMEGAAVTGHWCGLRPGRSGGCRLEAERAKPPVVHCYGHGGAGVTCSWGCADEVVALAKRAVGGAGFTS